MINRLTQFYDNHRYICLNMLVFLVFVLLIALYLLVSYQKKRNKQNSSINVLKELHKISLMTKKDASKIRSTPISKLRE